MLFTTRASTRTPHMALSPLLRPLSMALCAVLCALMAVLGSAAPASAHAVQTGSSPTEGTVVDSAPREVRVTWSEEVSLSDGAIRVLGPDGKRVDKNKVRVVGGSDVERAVSLKSDLPKGTYTVAWRAVSADSHPVAGAFTFSVGAPSATKADVGGGGGDSGTRLIDAFYQTGRYAAYAGFILLVGGAAFVIACGPRAASVRRLQRLVVTGWMTLTAATLLMLLMRNSYVNTGSLSEVFDLDGLKAVFGTKPGAALAARLLLLGTSAVIIAVLFGPYGRGRTDEAGTDGSGTDGTDTGTTENGGTDTGGASDASAADGTPEPDAAATDGTGAADGPSRDVTLGLCLGGGVVSVGLAATWAMSEHASAGLQTAVAMPVDIVHMLAVAAWLGGLAALLTCLHWGPRPSRATVRRFSQIAFGSVLTLVATGVYQSWRQLGSFSALTGTPYGKLLLAKIALIIVLLAAARASRRWVGRLAETPEPAVREAEPVGAAAVTAGADGTGADGTGADGAAKSEGSGAGPGTGPVRAAQLARQRAAVESTLRKKSREADPERGALRRSVLVETGVAVVLLAVTTGLTSTEPGRTEELAQAGSAAAAEAAQKRLGPVKEKIPFDTGGPKGEGTAELWITPGQAGGNSLRVVTKGPGGKPLEASEVKAALRLPLQDLGPIAVPFETINSKKDRWRSEVVQVPLAGRWKVALTIRTSDIDQVTETITVQID
ncbi:copper transport protein [Streptomyces sp. WMMB 714]|uniref:copper resistance CopC/CopD family protein n=1 Tax=Streptomyces sp. WMMB 714 TaxID=1286822 RepID=UPI000823ECE9|nr:copper resistance protein CopC [Streptomyces sp. WMMB 714]SCK21771.1 copper transport protein [Streptomyces sp. WMMB 714]